jgi:glycine cleavage system transcriptional repressor
MKKVIISVLGADKPGIIAAITRILFHNDCNIENVSQTILQSEFSGTFIAGMPDELSYADLHKRLSEEMTPLDLQVHLKSIATREPHAALFACEPFVITTRGPDQKGLVARITEIIARYSVNVTNLQAVFKGGDDPNNNIMIYEVDVPLDCDQKSLHRDLRDKADELGLRLSIQHRNIFEAINRI